MELLFSLILGVVQGLTEFIPVSSSGHLVIFDALFNSSKYSVSYFALLHLGTVFSLLFVYWRDVGRIFLCFVESLGDLLKRDLYSIKNHPDKKLGWLIIFTTLPTGIIGVSFNDFFEKLFSNLLITSLCLLVTGTILFLIKGKSGTKGLSDIGIRTALLIGIAQGCAIVPGISRSGLTISAGILCGFNQTTAAKYAFLVSIPSIFGAFVFEFQTLKDIDLLICISGFFASFISGYIAIKLVLKAVQKKRLVVFAWYCWTIGTLITLGLLSGIL
jgi:undecaprenyl-diphosphatase